MGSGIIYGPNLTIFYQYRFNTTMNVYKPKGSSVYYARFQVAGKRYNQTTKCEDKATAMKILKLKRNAVIAQRWEVLEETKFRTDAPTIDQVVDVYLGLPKRCADKTAKRNVGNLLRILETLGAKPGGRRATVLTRDLVEGWMIREQGLGKLDRSARRRENISINSRYNQAKDVFPDYLLGDYARAGLQLPDLTEFRKVPKLPEPQLSWEPIPQEQYDAMHRASLDLRKVNYELWLVNQLLRRLGLRSSELLAARGDWVVDIAGGRKALKICDRPEQGYRVKGALPRALPLDDDLLELLAGRAGFLIQADSAAKRKELIERVHNRWVKPFFPGRRHGNHELRAHVGSVILTRTGSIEEAQRYLGHTTPETTRKHYATFLGSLAQVTAADIATHTGLAVPVDE